MTYITGEELRQQLAEQVPGAISLIARGLEVSPQALLAAVEAGRVTWVAATVALARGMREQEEVVWPALFDSGWRPSMTAQRWEAEYCCTPAPRRPEQ